MAKNTSKKPTAGKNKKSEILGIILVIFSLLLFASVVSHNPVDWPGSSHAFDEPSKNLIGWYGAFMSHHMLEWFGYTSYAIVLIMAVSGGVIFLHRKLRTLLAPILFAGVWGVFLPLLVALIADIGADNTRVEPAFRYGGIVGGLLAHNLVTYLGKTGTYLVSLAVLLVALVLTTNLKPSTLVEFIGAVFKPLGSTIIDIVKHAAKRTRPYRRTRQNSMPDGRIVEKHADDSSFLTPLGGDGSEEWMPPDQVSGESESPAGPATSPIEPTISGKRGGPEPPEEAIADHEDENKQLPETLEKILESEPIEYICPGPDLLNEPRTDEYSEPREEMLGQAQRIVESLRHFNIDSEVRQITPGPIVTRYELTLAPGIKVGRVVGLSNDLTMALRAKGGIRIIAPIPGKAAIGIEVPNKVRAPVSFREIVDSEAFMNLDKPLALAIGKGTSGEPVVTDLAKMPHLLIAGATGSGKSVCINTIVASIVMKAAPSDVRMILIDPKVVELSIYNAIPHLLTSVITDPKKAAGALRWAVHEMETRYRKLAVLGVRNIHQYNEKVDELLGQTATGETETNGVSSDEKLTDDEQLPLSNVENGTVDTREQPEHLPLIVIIIDEFADLMVVASNEIEELIARLAQMARAVGMHLVLATQRPSADVITGLIKANFPSRIAFKVMQASNSRIILDEGGADKLLGLGDMLFLQAGKPEPVRMHGALITSEECQRIVDFIESQTEEHPTRINDEEFQKEEEEVQNTLGLRDPNERDQLFFEAARLVVRHNQGSVSLLQRRLKVGYARAARLIDQLELNGIVSPYDGSKAREVLVDYLYIDELEAGDF